MFWISRADKCTSRGTDAAASFAAAAAAAAADDDDDDDDDDEPGDCTVQM